MVTDHDEVGILQNTGFFAGIQQHAQITVQIVPCFVDMGAEHTLNVAVMVEGAGVHQQQFGLELPDHITGDGENEIVHHGPLHHVQTAALFITFGKQIRMGFDEVKHFLAGTCPGKAGAQRVAGFGHPVFVHQVIHVGVAAGDGPGHTGGGITAPLGGGEDILHLNRVGEPVPGGFLIGDGEAVVAHNTVLACIAAGDHGNVVGIGDGGIDGTHTAGNLTAAAEHTAEVGTAPHGLDIFADHSVHRKNKQSFLHSR